MSQRVKINVNRKSSQYEGLRNEHIKQTKSINMKFGKVILPLLLASSMLFIGYRYFMAPPAGFCVAQNRVLTDAEFLTNVSDVRRYSPDQMFAYGKYSVLNCCNITRVEGGFWSKVFRVDEGVTIGWAYERKKAEPTNPKEDKYFLVTDTFNSCNTKLLNGSGITENDLPANNQHTYSNDQ